MITIRFADQEDLPGLLPLMTQLGYACTREELEDFLIPLLNWMAVVLLLLAMKAKLWDGLHHWR